MESVTVHRINEHLVVSLQELPGFSKLGSCMIRDENRAPIGKIVFYYTGECFKNGTYRKHAVEIDNQLWRLARNRAIRNGSSDRVCRVAYSTKVRIQLEGSTRTHLEDVLPDHLPSILLSTQ